jgi:SAM-dependent methyltransferase
MHAAGGVHEHALRIVESRLPRGARVLDVGSGSGALAARLLARGFAVIASDFDGSDYRAQPPFVQWDASSLDLPGDVASSSLDGVCAIEVLEHVENPAQALRNFYQVLRPGGLLVVSTPNLAHPRSRVKFLLRGAPSYFGRVEFRNSGHRTMLPHWMLDLAIEEAGFEDVNVTFAGSLGLSGLSKLSYAAASPIFSILGMQPTPKVDDGCITFAAARRPA